MLAFANVVVDVTAAAVAAFPLFYCGVICCCCCVRCCLPLPSPDILFAGRRRDFAYRTAASAPACKLSLSVVVVVQGVLRPLQEDDRWEKQHEEQKTSCKRNKLF